MGKKNKIYRVSIEVNNGKCLMRHLQMNDKSEKIQVLPMSLKKTTKIKKSFVGERKYKHPILATVYLVTASLTL
jgi:hypothetical protein